MRKRLSWKFGYRHGKAGRAFDCPWWAIEETYQVAYLLGKLRGVKSPPSMEDRAPYIRPLEIRASKDPSDYEIENSESHGSTLQCVGCERVIRIAAIHKIGPAVAHQSFDLPDRS